MDVFILTHLLAVCLIALHNTMIASYQSIRYNNILDKLLEHIPHALAIFFGYVKKISIILPISKDLYTFFSMYVFLCWITYYPSRSAFLGDDDVGSHSVIVDVSLKVRSLTCVQRAG